MDAPAHLVPNDEPLPDLALESLRLSPTEVIHAFHKPFQSLVNPSYIREHAFRGGEPYYAIDVTEEIRTSGVQWSPSPGIDEVGGSDIDGRLEIWGLTGWYLNVFLKIMGLYA